MALRSLCIVSLRSQTGIARLQNSNATSSQNKWRAYLVQKWSTAETRNFSNRLINGTSHDYMQNRHSFCHLLDRSLHVEFRPAWSLYSTITYPCECCHLATQVLMQSVESILDDHERFWVCSIPQRNLTFFFHVQKGKPVIPYSINSSIDFVWRDLP